MIRLWILSVLLSCLGFVPVANGQDDYCFGKDTERLQTRHFGTLTAYQIAKATNVDKQYLVPNCRPEKIWILHKHGTRLPSKYTIDQSTRLEELRDLIVKNYRVQKTAPDRNALCPEDLIALQMWRWNSSITSNMEYYLTSQGYEDLRGTAKLYQKYYPTVLLRDYNHPYYLFRDGDSQSTEESFKAFAEGLFGRNNRAELEEAPSRDYLMRPEDYCRTWQRQNVDGEDSEYHKFRHSFAWMEMLSDVSKRLGFRYTLESIDVELMYEICRYEQAWQVDRTSVWCAAFTPSQVEMFEYAEDLKHYYKYGQGHEINTHLNCRMVQDMAQHLSSDSLPNAIVYFVHTAGLETFLAALDIAKDDLALLADGHDRATDRKWRTSSLDPFAANFVAIKHRCPGDQDDSEKVLFLLNQQPVQLDWCQVGLCKWSEVLSRYKHILQSDCSAYYCSGAHRISSVSNYWMMWIGGVSIAIAYLISHL